MRKLLVCLVAIGACLLSTPRQSEAALPCGSYCCSAFPGVNAASPCMYPAGVWTTCGWYGEHVAACP